MNNLTDAEKAERLTEREKEVLQLLADGLTSIQIGEQLNISAHTVATHRKNMKRKLSVRTSADLIRIALAVRG